MHLIPEALSQKSLVSDLKIPPCSIKSSGEESVFLSLDQVWVYRKGTEPLPQRGTTDWNMSGMTTCGKREINLCGEPRKTARSDKQILHREEDIWAGCEE